jgi:hypothetical protein
MACVAEAAELWSSDPYGHIPDSQLSADRTQKILFSADVRLISFPSVVNDLRVGVRAWNDQLGLEWPGLHLVLHVTTAMSDHLAVLAAALALITPHPPPVTAWRRVVHRHKMPSHPRHSWRYRVWRRDGSGLRGGLEGTLLLADRLAHIPSTPYP